MPKLSKAHRRSLKGAQAAADKLRHSEEEKKAFLTALPMTLKAPKNMTVTRASQDASPSRDALHRPGTISSITDAD